jgi:hypothetical protein
MMTFVAGLVECQCLGASSRNLKPAAALVQYEDEGENDDKKKKWIESKHI